MTTSGLRVHRDSYVDSMLLMLGTASMDALDGVSWAGATLANARGLDDLAAAGFSGGELDGLGANDLVLAVKADDEQTAGAALDAGEQAVFSEQQAPQAGAHQEPPASIAEAVRRTEGLNVAIVSVPGEHAALEAHHALTAGLHVLLFSDNVPLDQEVELKERAAALGLLVMGPGAGTAVLGGTGLGFANALGSTDGGAVGVVAAAGTGAQEVSALLDRWGVRVSQVVGVGGRDLSEAVGGRMAQLAARALDADPGTAAVLLVSKPASPASAAAVLAECTGTPAVAVFLGLTEVEAPDGVTQAATLEQGALAAARLAGATPPDVTTGLAARVAEAAGRLPASRTRVRGLFSGGTLCYEAQFVLEGLLGPVYSNEPLRKENTADAAPAGAHVLLDLGAEEFTVGRPHPMIDPSSRLELLAAVRDETDVGVVLLDVVLGHGAHEDPAGQLAPVCAELSADGGPVVVAYLLGTEADPQVYSRQRAVLEAAGCLVPETNARGAYAAAALVLRRPEVAETRP
ncbi:MAG: protein FdrA [Frankiales bacterium]|nr:protein FdrA [Frankiales bacterium]